MTSIQLPPLQFDEGGFRVSIITGPRSSNPPAPEPQPDPDAEPPTEPSTELSTEPSTEPSQRDHQPAPLPTVDEVPSPRPSPRPDTDEASETPSPRPSPRPDAHAETPSPPPPDSHPGAPSPRPDTVAEAETDARPPRLGALRQFPPVLTRERREEREEREERDERDDRVDPGADSGSAAQTPRLSIVQAENQYRGADSRSVAQASSVYDTEDQDHGVDSGSDSGSAAQTPRLSIDQVENQYRGADSRSVAQSSSIYEPEYQHHGADPAFTPLSPASSIYEPEDQIDKRLVEPSLWPQPDSGDRTEVAIRLDPASAPMAQPPSPSRGSIPPSPAQTKLPASPAGSAESKPHESTPDEPKPDPQVVFTLDEADDAQGGDTQGQHTPVAAKTAQLPAVPSHPVESLRVAFTESLEEATSGNTDKPNLRELDARGRKDRLLDQGKDDPPLDSLWRYRPGQKEHEVLKLIAQISFGVYLLLNGMANDNAQVVTILQGHINEVDEFLEVTLEDLDQAAIDLNERLDYLRIPMSNMKVFEEMLEDRNYRAEILEGNEKIEQVLSRMNAAMRQWEDDVEAGLQGTAAFTEWLTSLENGSWRRERPDLEEIFEAMKGNTEGWLGAFEDMSSRSHEINALTITLMTVVADIEKKAGEVSRKTWSTIPPFTSPTSSNAMSRRDTASASSARSDQAHSRSLTGDSGRSTALSTGQRSQADELLDHGSGDDRSSQAGGLGSRASGRMSRRSSGDAPKLRVETAPIPSPVREATTEEENEASPLYTLQPRTYTPRTPQPSPLITSNSSSSPPSPTNWRHPDPAPMRPPPHAASIRERVSPSMDTRVPTPGGHERNASRASSGLSAVRQSPVGRVMIRESSSGNLRVRDSGASSGLGFRDSSGSEMDSVGQHRVPRAASNAELRQVRPSMTPSANSDYQHYHPVLASPHSPLQQRPHTAAGPHGRQPSGHLYGPGQKQPSRLGSMATMSTIGSEARTTKTARTVTPSTRSSGSKTVKKKKSAFGWLKKAFTMDEEERAAFEARKTVQYQDNYYKDKDPKFLDGKRMR